MAKTMGECVVCAKETCKVLFKNADYKIYICCEKCLQTYFSPVGGVRVQGKPEEDEAWLDCTLAQKQRCK